MTIQFPDTPSSNLLWSQMLLVWCFTHYFLGRTKLPAERNDDPIPLRHCLAAAVLVAFLPGFSCENCEVRVALLALTGVLSAILLSQRQNPSSATASPMTPAIRELSITFLFGLTSACLIAGNRLEIRSPLLVIGLPTSQLALAVMTTAVAAFMTDGGTIVVRGVLDRCGTKPLLKVDRTKAEANSEVDATEYNRGRIIGELERVLLVALVFLDQYFALSFLLGAKGLIRSKEFEDRNFAEYFLIGTLTSILLAVAAGLALQRYAVWLGL